MTPERVAQLRALLDDEMRTAVELGDALADVLDEAEARAIPVQLLREALAAVEPVDGSDVRALARAFGRLRAAAQRVADAETGGAR